MNKIRTSKFVEFSASTLALLTIVLVVTVNSVSAKEHKSTGSATDSRVIAHIPFGELSAVDMAMQRRVNDKYYVYVQHAKNQGFSIIDVTNPAQPKSIGETAWPSPGGASWINVTGDVAIIEENRVVPTSHASNDDLVLWDLSNPSTPRVVQKFSGVVKWLQDERKFIYVLNGEGLWVISNTDHDSEQTNSTLSYGG
jgi:LVIVD repeat